MQLLQGGEVIYFSKNINFLQTIWITPKKCIWTEVESLVSSATSVYFCLHLSMILIETHFEYWDLVLTRKKLEVKLAAFE